MKIFKSDMKFQYKITLLYYQITRFQKKNKK